MGLDSPVVRIADFDFKKRSGFDF